MTDGPFRFADFEFDAATGELRHRGATVRLEPQPAKALALLLGRAGELVTREELRVHLWPGDVSVDFDRGLAYCISQVRSALGDSADAPRFVETLPRRGFRFIAALESHEPPRREPPRTWMSSGAARLAALVLLAAAAWGVWQLTFRPDGRPTARVLAVALFDNETGDPTYDRVVAGFSDAIIGNLVDLPRDEIAVAGQNRVLRLPRSERDLARIAADTGATYVVLGQLQRRDTDLVVYAHLLHIPDGRHVWGGTFPTADGQIGNLHAQVANEVGGAVRERLLGGGR
jgi:DNA-binding winged helix-turn-helix (wHTH) protein